MKEKVFKDVLYCGVLTTRSGKEYWLISPHPLLKDWEQDRQQRFVVVPKTIWDIQDGVEYFSYQRNLIVTDPEIEYRYNEKSIKIMDLQEWDVANEVEPAGKSDLVIPADVAETMKEFQYE